MAAPIRVTIIGIEEVRLMLTGIKNGVPKVMTRAGNRAIDSTISKAGKIVRRQLNLSVKEAKRGFASKKFTYSKPSGYFLTKNRPYPGISPEGKFNFGFRKLKKGYSVKVTKGAGTTKLKSAFKIRTKRGTNIAVRTGRGRWAIKQFWSLSPADILGGNENKELTDHAADVLQRRMDHEVERLLQSNA